MRVWRQLCPDEVEVVLVAEEREPVVCAKGMRVLPDTRWDDLRRVDVLVYPGGRGTRRQLGDERIRDRLRELRSQRTLLTSVCTGALVYADAGLLDGRAATTHWRALEELQSLGREIDPLPDDRFVDTGEIVTAAGISAGIDMALHLVGRLGSPEQARAVRRQMQYDPEPPY